jgi:hypothetical protein
MTQLAYHPLPNANATFPDRLRYAAEILREAATHQRTNSTRYNAIELEDLAAEYEANQHHKNQEIEELARIMRGCGISNDESYWRRQAERIVDAGWHKTGDQ